MKNGMKLKREEKLTRLGWRNLKSRIEQFSLLDCYNSLSLSQHKTMTTCAEAITLPPPPFLFKTFSLSIYFLFLFLLRCVHFVPRRERMREPWNCPNVVLTLSSLSRPFYFSTFAWITLSLLVILLLLLSLFLSLFISLSLSLCFTDKTPVLNKDSQAWITRESVSLTWTKQWQIFPKKGRKGKVRTHTGWGENSHRMRRELTQHEERTHTGWGENSHSMRRELTQHEERGSWRTFWTDTSF